MKPNTASIGAVAFATTLCASTGQDARAQAATAPVPMPEIIVRPEPPTQDTTAGPVQGIRALSASSATRTDTPIERLPQNLQVIPRAMIDQQGAVSITEALRNASNVLPVDSRIIGNVAQNPLTIRGFGADQWVDGYPGNLFLAGDRDGLVNVERIEVLKGPNALLYGGGAGSAVGGAINVVSKMPTGRSRYEVGATFGSHHYLNGFMDIDQALDADKKALFRLTTEYTASESFIDVIDAKRYGINPTLVLALREGTSLTVQGFASRHRQQAYPGLPVEGTLFGEFRVRRELYVGPADILPTTSQSRGLTVTFDHRFNPTWSTNTRLRFSRSENDQHSQSPLLDATFTGGTPVLPPSTFDLNNTEVFDKQREFSINPSLQARFDAGATRNTLLVGADYSRIKDSGFMNVDTLGNFCFALGFGCPPVLVDLANPVFTAPYVRPVPGVGEGSSFFLFDNTYVTKGAYAQLQSTLRDRLHLLAGLRVASIDIDYTESALAAPTTFKTSRTRWLPRAGAVVDVTEALSAYASYGEGMKWVPFAQTFAEPRPEQSRQGEAGLKFNVGNALTGTLAVFQIERENVPFRTSAGDGALSTQKSRGFEADVIYQPNRNWSVLASYGVTDAYFVDSTSPTIAAGNKLVGVPKRSGRVWATYRFDGARSGWSAGAGLQTASSQFVDAQNRWRTGGYTTVDARIAYETRRLRASLAVKNLADRSYYTPYPWFGGQVAPGEPRSIYGQLSFAFE